MDEEFKYKKCPECGKWIKKEWNHCPKELQNRKGQFGCGWKEDKYIPDNQLIPDKGYIEKYGVNTEVTTGDKLIKYNTSKRTPTEIADILARCDAAIRDNEQYNELPEDTKSKYVMSLFIQSCRE